MDLLHRGGLGSSLVLLLLMVMVTWSNGVATNVQGTSTGNPQSLEKTQVEIEAVVDVIDQEPPVGNFGTTQRDLDEVLKSSTIVPSEDSSERLPSTLAAATTIKTTSLRTNQETTTTTVTPQNSTEQTHQAKRRGTVQGSNRQGQRVVVRKWNLSQNSRPVNSNRRRTASVVANRRLQTTRTGRPGTDSRQRRLRSGVYPASQAYASKRRAAIRGRAYSPRARSSVFNTPARKGKTYRYPFGDTSRSNHSRQRSYRLARRRSSNGEAGQGLPNALTRRHPPSQISPGRRGSQTQAVTRADVHSQIQNQQPDNPNYQQQQLQQQWRQQQQQQQHQGTADLASGTHSASVTLSAFGQSSNQHSLPATGTRSGSQGQGTVSSSSQGTQTRQYYRPVHNSQQSSHSSTHNSRYYPTSQQSSHGALTGTVNGQASQTNQNQYRGHTYTPTAQQQQRQTYRSSRFRPVYSGYQPRNQRYHTSRSTHYPGSRTSGGHVFTSYAVTDDGECPDTGIDLRINGLNCQQAIQQFGQYLCYSHEYTSKMCCEMCLPRKRQQEVGCEYGDHARQCSSISASDCYDRRNELSCCQTCSRFRRANAPVGCEYGDMIGSQRCDEVRRNPGLCYIPDNQRLCCATCSALKNVSNPSCSWGDQNSRLCQIFAPNTGDVRINCYSPYRRRLCCQSCQRLKNWLPQTLPANCEYGDRPVIFNAGQHGHINCGNILTYFSVDECSENPVVSRNCCHTCHRHMNATVG